MALLRGRLLCSIGFGCLSRWLLWKLLCSFGEWRVAAVSHPGRALHPEHALPSATRNWQPPGEGVFAVLAEAADPSMSLDEMEVVHAPEASALPLTSLVPRDEATFCYEDYVDKYEKTEEEAQEVTAGTTSGHSWWQNWGEWEDGGDILAESSTWTSIQLVGEFNLDLVDYLLIQFFGFSSIQLTVDLGMRQLALLIFHPYLKMTNMVMLQKKDG
eukprot:s4025_g7.t1